MNTKGCKNLVTLIFSEEDILILLKDLFNLKSVKIADMWIDNNCRCFKVMLEGKQFEKVYSGSSVRHALIKYNSTTKKWGIE